jgi:hypothetical protein
VAGDIHLFLPLEAVEEIGMPAALMIMETGVTLIVMKQRFAMTAC